MATPALVNPHAQKPGSLPSPIPTAPPPEMLSPTAPGKPIEMPPLEIQAGREPAQADLGEFGALPSVGEAAAAPAAATDLGEFGALPDVGKVSPETAAFSLPTPGEPVAGYTPPAPEVSGAPTFVKLPNGQYGTLDPQSKEVKELSPKEKEAFSYAAKAIRVGGPVVGSLFGNVLAGMIGAPAMQAAVHPAASVFETIAGEKPKELTATELVATSALTGAGGAIGKLASSGKGAILPGLSKVETQSLEQAGAKTLGAESAQATKVAKETGIPLQAEEINPQGKLSKNELVITGRDQQLVDELNNVRENVGPKVTESGAKQYSFKTELENLNKQLGSAVRTMIDRLKPHVRQRRFDVGQLLGDSEAILGKYSGGAPRSLRGEINKLKAKTSPEVSAEGFGTQTKFTPAKPGQTTLSPYDEMGRTTPNVKPEAAQATPAKATGMQPFAAGKGTRGLTFDELENLRNTAKANANFDSPNRTAQDKAWGEFYNAIKNQRNSVVEAMANEAGDPSLSNNLKIANKAYSDSVDKIDNLVSKLSEDPSMIGAARIILQKNNPKELRDFFDLIPEGKKAEIQRIMADDIIGNPTRENLGAKSMEDRLNSYDLKSQELIFGGSLPELRRLINVGKIIESGTVKKEASGISKVLNTLLTSHYSFVKKAAKIVLDRYETLVGPPTKGSQIGKAVGAGAIPAMRKSHQKESK